MFHSTKVYLNRYFFYLTFFVALLLGGSSCTCVHDDYMHCDITIAVTPFFQTPCMDTPSYPEHIKNILAVVTDESGNIVHHQYYAEFTPSEDAKLHMALPHNNLKGKLYCTLWANVLYPDYLVSPNVENNSELTQYLVQPVCDPVNELWVKLLPTLYCATEEVAIIPDKKLTEPLYFEKRMNLTRYTNDFNVTLQVNGVTENTSMLFEIYDENLAYFLNGELSNPRKHVFYKNIIEINREPKVEFYEKKFTFSTMRLDLPISAYDNTYKGPSFYLKQLRPTPSDPSKAKVIADTPLLDWFKAAGTNLACEFEHQMIIQCNVASSGTHMGVIVWLDNFRVFSYDVEL